MDRRATADINLIREALAAYAHQLRAACHADEKGLLGNRERDRMRRTADRCDLIAKRMLADIEDRRVKIRRDRRR